LPVTRNGKLDRHRLQELPWDLPQVAPGIPPRDPVERVLADLFAAALRVPEIGVDQDFFDRGGHSLLAVSVLQGIEKHFGETLPLSTIIGHPTVERLAALLRPEGAAQEMTRTSVVKLRAGGSQPIFFIHDGEGEIIPYRSLALCLDRKYSVYGVQPLSRRNQPMLHTRLSDMVDHYVEQIRQVQPQGPYVLGGLCIGGFLASEVARRLRGHGESVALIALFESAHVTAERKSETSQMFARFSKGVREDAGGGVVVKLLNVLRHLRRKVPNVVRYQLSSRLKRAQTTFKVRVLRTCLDFGIPVPSLAEGLDVSAILHFAEREYVVQPPYAGEVVLYRATHRDAQFDGTAIDDTPYLDLFVDPFFGWKDHADNIEAHEVSGGHSSMFVAPHVDAFAKLFEAHVQRALERCEQTRGAKVYHPRRSTSCG
jgi:thioesterase domain-containing protein